VVDLTSIQKNLPENLLWWGNEGLSIVSMAVEQRFRNLELKVLSHRVPYRLGQSRDLRNHDCCGGL